MRPEFNWSALLQAVALLAIAIICGLLLFYKVPDENQQLLSFGLGALSGVLTGAAARQMLASKKESSNEPPANP